jgi:UDP-glucose 4-epimerase
MRALVTGGAGFIGSNLVERLLAEGYEVDVIDDLSTGSLANLADARRSAPGRMRFHQLDVRAAALGEVMARSRPTVVFHLAASGGPAPSVREPVSDAEVNVIGSLRVLDAARTSGVQKVVFASGAAIYGEADPSDLPIRESHPQRPVSPHGAAKKAVADYLIAYRELHSLEFTSLVLASVYGPRQRARGSGGVIATFAARLLAGEACVIHGEGTQTRDFVFVDDVVDAFARASTRGGGLLLNVGTATETTINDLYQAMAAQAGVDHPAGLAPAPPGETARSCLDPGRAAIHLGWKPWTALDEGITAVFDWWRESPPGGAS